MMERQIFRALDQAIGKYTTRDDTYLKAGLKASIHYLLKTMARIVKGTFIVNHEDDKATEIDKFIVVLELNHASLFGDATYKINLSRQTKLRRPHNLPVDEDLSKVTVLKRRSPQLNAVFYTLCLVARSGSVSLDTFHLSARR